MVAAVAGPTWQYPVGQAALAATTSLVAAMRLGRRGLAAHTLLTGLTLALLLRSSGTSSSEVAVAAVAIGVSTVAGLRLRSDRLADDAAANTDQLTGVANRRGLDRWATTSSARWLMVLALDVDDLKGVNDAQGHPAGDEVLRRLGAALLREQRPGQLAVRLGGDEFALLVALPARVEHPVRVADRLLGTARDALDAAATASIGVAQGRWSGPGSLASVLQQADVALYAAKARGGDRVVVAS